MAPWLSGPDGAPENAADLASAALIGALLWQPDRVRDVRDWLTPHDLPHPAHRAIYETLLGLADHGQNVDLTTLPTILARGTYHDVHVPRDGTGPLGAAGLAGLLSFTPATAAPDAARDRTGAVDESRAVHITYARLVLEASIRRQVAGAGTRIAQHAADPAIPDRAPAVLAQTLLRLTELVAQLDAARPRSRIEQAFGTEPRPGPASPGSTGRGSGGGAGRGGPDPDPAGLTAPPLPAAMRRRAEHTLIAGALVSALVREHATARLRASDFTDLAAASTWTAIEGLVRSGGPVDVVLVADAVERQPVGAERGTGFTAGQLMRLAACGTSATGMDALLSVAADALARTVARAGEQVRVLAGDRSRPAPEMLRVAHQVLTAIRIDVDRLAETPAPAPLHALLTLTPNPARPSADEPGTGQPPAAAPGPGAALGSAAVRAIPPARRPPSRHRRRARREGHEPTARA